MKLYKCTEIMTLSANDCFGYIVNKRFRNPAYFGRIACIWSVFFAIKDEVKSSMTSMHTSQSLSLTNFAPKILAILDSPYSSYSLMFLVRLLILERRHISTVLGFEIPFIALLLLLDSLISNLTIGLRTISVSH